MSEDQNPSDTRPEPIDLLAAVIAWAQQRQVEAEIAAKMALDVLTSNGYLPQTPTPNSQMNGARPLPIDRDQLGRFVRDAWIRWAKMQPEPKPSWLVPYDELSEPDKEADRIIGESVARWTLIGDAMRASGAQDTSWLRYLEAHQDAQ